MGGDVFPFPPLALITPDGQVAQEPARPRVVPLQSTPPAPVSDWLAFHKPSSGKSKPFPRSHLPHEQAPITSNPLQFPQNCF